MNATAATIPDELRDLPRFVLWSKEPRFAGEKPTKIPYDPKTLRRAKSNDPMTWASFTATLEVLERWRTRFVGLGFVLGDDAPFFGYDLDDCRDPIAGLIVPRAREIIARMNTYSEVSQSQCGVKGIGRGTMPTPDGTGKNFRRDPWGTGTGGIEMYRRGRFFALTGQHLEGTPSTIEHRTDELAALYRELYPPASPHVHRRRTFCSGGANAVRQCGAYLRKMPASVSGQGGHDKLLAAACCCLRFGLDDDDAMAMLVDFNGRCSPPWDERDLIRKLSEAHKLAGHDFGSMLKDRPEPSNWRIVATIGGGL